MALIDDLRAQTQNFFKQRQGVQPVKHFAAMAAPSKPRFSTFDERLMDQAMDLVDRYMAIAMSKGGDTGLEAALQEVQKDAATTDLDMVKFALMVFITHFQGGAEMSRNINLPGRGSSTSIMKRLSHVMGEQLGNPQGLPGRLVGWVLTKNNASINTWIVQLLDIQSTDHILEVGCGPGLGIQGLSARATQGFVAGIDTSVLMVQQASRRNAAAIKAGRVEIQQGDASKLPYADASFDKVVAVHVIYFWSDAVATLQELRRVLQPNGVVAIGFLIKERAPRLTQKAFAQTGATLYPAAEDVADLLATAGFTHIRVQVQQASGGSPGCCALGQS